MTFETAEMRELMLVTMHERYSLDLDPLAVVRLIPGKDHHLMADFHNPYDTEMQRYIFVTTEAEVLAHDLKPDVVLISPIGGRKFTIINLSPDETQWVVINASWDDANVN